VVLTQVRTLLGVDAASVLLRDPRSERWQFAAGQGFQTTGIQHSRLEPGNGPAGRALLEQRLIHVAELNAGGVAFPRA
jgi:hypothetical protein